MPECVIVIPCYNEANRLRGDEFKQYLSSRPNVSFLFVNDGSTDQTLLLLEQTKSQMPEQIQVLNRPVNAGKAEAGAGAP